jgi:hypothetical protein
MNEAPPQSYLGYYPDSEVVLGIVCPLSLPQLKHCESWDKMERASEHAQNWPQWMKGSPVNRREALNTTPS